MATKTIKIGLSDSDKATMSATIKAAVNANIASDYSSSATYDKGAYCVKDGVIYKCKSAISTAETWNSAHWETAKLAEVIAAVEKDKLTKGDYDATTGVGYADVANNLTPYSDESGAFQDNPMISQGTGTDNNTAIVTTGNYAQLREKQGNSVVVNQLIKNSEFASTSYWQTNNGSLSVSNGVGTFTYSGSGSNGWAQSLISANVPLIAGHKYLLTFNLLERSLTDPTGVQLRINNYPNQGSNYSNAQTVGIHNMILSPNYTVSGGIQFGVFNAYQNGDYFKLRDVLLIDLTQMFAGNVPQDLLDHPENLFRYYNGSLAYNAGSLENSDGVKLVRTKRQLWDEVSEVGTYSSTTGLPTTSTKLRSKNMIRVVPGSTYYYYNGAGYGTELFYYDADKNYVGYGATVGSTTFTTPANCCYINIAIATAYGQTYNDDITISLYYTPEEGGEGYSEHYAYEEPTVIDTGSEVLRSAGSAHDVKLPDGTITRNIGVVDLGTLTWNYTSEGDSSRFYTSELASVIKPSATNDAKGNVLCARYSNLLAWNVFIYQTKTGDISLRTDGYLAIRDLNYTDAAAFKTAMSGVYLFYELATPTTETGTPFPENIDIDDYGMMYWLDEDDELVGIPQGAKFFYPVNYKGFTDDLYNRTEGDAGNVVIQSELSASETARDTVDAQLKAALGGTLRQLLAVKESIDFLDTNYVDLSVLNWSLIGNSYWSVAFADAEVPSSATIVGKILATKYKNRIPSSFSVNSVNGEMCIAPEGVININNGSTTEKPSGLLAYKKASE